jgi:agmatine/peptidylarginine deiminase
MRSRGRRIVLAATICALGAQLAVGQPVDPVRVVAEWEPAAGTLISWPLGIPQELVEELARDDLLFVLVTGSSAQSQARQTFSSWGIDPDQVEYIHASVQTKWPRDWGPHQIFDGNGEWAIVDPIFEGYPWVPAPCQPVSSPGGHHGDDAVNIDVAAHFGAPLHALPAYLTGGNFLVDGHTAAFSTCAMVGENEQLWTEGEFLALADQYLGIASYHVVDNTEDYGIQHIDCWFKPLDEETLLVKRPPASHEEFDRIQANLESLALERTRYGRPYRIIRIDTPPFDGYNVAAYTNSLILNGKILVPLFNVPGDADAIATFEAAMPGYDVIGFPWGGWYHYDALHCRTRAIFDRHMLRITHRRPAAWVAEATEHPITAFIDDRSEAGLVPEELGVSWREEGAADWNWVPLAPAGEPDLYSAAIPAQPPGTTVAYFIAAADQTGRVETLPRTAPDGYYTFTVGCEPIVLTVQKTNLAWTGLAGATGYDVVQGDLDTLHDSEGNFTVAVDACVANDHPGLALLHGVQPEPGAGFWFLVRAVAPSGNTSYFFSADCERMTRDALIDVALPACP